MEMASRRGVCEPRAVTRRSYAQSVARLWLGQVTHDMVNYLLHWTSYPVICTNSSPWSLVVVAAVVATARPIPFRLPGKLYATQRSGTQNNKVHSNGAVVSHPLACALGLAASKLTTVPGLERAWGIVAFKPPPSQPAWGRGKAEH